jgi:hypothetical protein
MQAIEALIAGIPAAADGTVELYERGTSTRATWYTTFEGEVAVSSGADIALDSYGSAEAYINQLVTCVVKDATGATVRSFTVGESANNVEYRGQSFTGTNYESSSTGAGSAYPVQLQAILDLWKTNSGAVDWKVLQGDSAVTLQVALGALTGLVFNVKSPTYGAAGDFTTDDTAAIQAALTAAGVAAANGEEGAYVFFPIGTYRITAVLNVPNYVHMVGVGTNGSIIAVDHPTQGTLAFASGIHTQTVTGIRLAAMQANTGAVVTLASGSQVALRDCLIGQAAWHIGTLVSLTSSTTTSFSAYRTRFEVGTTSTANMVSSANTARITLEDCDFTTPATYTPTNAVVYGNAMSLRNCRFINTATSSGTVVDVAFSSTTVVGDLHGCTFTNGGGGTVTAIALGTYVAASTFSEVGSVFGSTVTAYSYVFAVANIGALVALHSRTHRTYRVTSNAATVALPTDQYGVCIVSRSNAAAQSITATVPPEGAFGVVHVIDTGGAGFTETLSTGFEPNDATRASAIVVGAEHPSFVYVAAAIGAGVRCQALTKWDYT